MPRPSYNLTEKALGDPKVFVVDNDFWDIKAGHYTGAKRPCRCRGCDGRDAYGVRWSNNKIQWICITRIKEISPTLHAI